MDKSKKTDPCPYNSINIFSKASVWWLNPYFKKGYKRQFKSSDLYPIAENHKAGFVVEKLSRNWDSECINARRKNKTPNFTWVFWKTYFWPFFLIGFTCVLSECCRAFGPFFIGELSYFFVNPSEVSWWYPYLCAFGLTMSAVLYINVDNIVLMDLQTLGWNARCAVISLMYKKTLKLNHKALSESTSGKIVNLTSTDALRFNAAFVCTHYLWLAPLECAILTYVLWLQLETAGLVGMFVLFFIMGIQTFMGKLFGKLRLKTAHDTDERVHVTNEVITGMRVVKMYSWEKSFKEILTNLRKKEMSHIFHASLLRAFNYTTKHSTTQILSLVTFTVFTSMHGTLNLQIVLVSLGLFTVLLLGAGLVFPFAVETIFQTFAALKRVQEFLLLPELTPMDIKSHDIKPAIRLDDFSASWSETEKPTLENININVEEPSLLMVVGPVAAGKSSLLNAILGELPATSGKIEISGKIAYSSQIPWLFSDSVRNNILFGEDFDAEKYEKVVSACALEQDFSILPSGDHTLVGERGITLSGGQKARVSLARAAYRSDSDIVVMDDPLSAVDPSVADHLFQECICGLLKDKIRVLVTHQVQFLNKSDQILILKEGRIVNHGKFDDLVQKGADFMSLIKIESNDVDDDLSSHEPIYTTQFSINSNESCVHTREKTNDAENPDEDKLVFRDAKETLLNKESIKDGSNTKASGSIQFHVFRDYFNSGLNSFVFFILGIAIIGSHTLIILVDWWLAQWAVASEKFTKQQKNQNTTSLYQSSRDNSTNQPINASNPTTTSYLFDQYYYLHIYAIMMFSYFALMYVRTALHYYMCVRSSVTLHTKMLASILKTKIRFFDTNPIGAILNRFSKDMNQVDEILPTILLDVCYDLSCVVAVVAFTLSVNYFVIIIVIPLLIYVVWIRKYYIATSREVKRIEGQERSPVFSHLSTTLQGLITIRTFQSQQKFITTYNHLLDTHGSAWSFHYFSKRWFGYRLDMINNIFIGSCAFLAVILMSYLSDDWPINPGNLGLTLTYSSSLVIWFQWGIRQTAEAENLMTSVERIQEYHKLPKESSDDNKAPPSDWPVNGEIKLINLSFSYYEGGPKVLKKINLRIKSNEKLGIVGRTGAGKSSIVASLFRMTDHMGGSIVIGGLDSTLVSLNDWRKALTIIPQDPFLFGGSMRKNLDPFSLYTDDQLWSALEKVQLKTVIENFPLKLQCVLTEAGSNLSVGQRQLVCLARAILRNNKILIIDEATANVDTRTDRLIQNTIRNEFSHCTVLTIAHRLDTIIDSDRILVLSDGEIVECDEPHKLLQNEEGSLTEMVRMTGSKETELRKAAEKAFNERRMKRAIAKTA